MLVLSKYDRGLTTTMLTKSIIVAVALVYCGMIFVMELGTGRPAYRLKTLQPAGLDCYLFPNLSFILNP